MCKAAGIPGYRTNHSLRATSATRLYAAGTDEQLIMERTGHRSIKGVRSYKRTSEEQEQGISDILSRAKRPQVTTLNPSPPVPSTSTVPHIPDLPFFNQHPLTYQHHNNMTGNSSIPAGFYLHSCNSVVININKNH